jgi:hypothetical protein
MAVQSSAGALLAICLSAPATYDAAGYGAKTYINVGEVTEIGEFGGEASGIDHSPLASDFVMKFKGSRNNGQLTPTMAYNPTDAGQIAMKASAAARAGAIYRVTFSDGKITYFMGLTMSFKPNVGSTDDLVTATATIEIDGYPIVEV